MQSSQGILIAFLRTPLARLGCGEDDDDAGFDIGVGGGGMSVFFSLEEVKTRSVADTVELWLGVDSSSMALSINLTASFPGPPRSVTAQAFGPGKHINASRILPLRVILHKVLSDRLR